MPAKLNVLVLLSIAALIGGCGGGGSDEDDAAVSSASTVPDQVVQASPSSAPTSGKDQLEQRTD